MEERVLFKNKIGIINLQMTHNYGAVIAAAVLEDVVRHIVDEKFIVETINYAAQKNYKTKAAQRFDDIKDTGGFKSYLAKKHFNKEINTSFEDEDFRKRRFYAFRDEYLNRKKEFVRNAYDINSSGDYAAFIVGSDIVWAPKKVDNYRADGYFLKFADKGEKKIAYAASLDCKPGFKLNRKKKYYKKNLKYLDCISVREKSSVPFIQSLTNKKVYECCDPAFLVDEEYYDKMISEAQISDKEKPFIYVYILEINQEIVDFANKLAREKGLKICYYSQYHNDFEGECENCYTDSPSEFLYRLKNAEYVLTNSFHCVVFSLLFKKQFLSFFRSSISIKSSDLLDKFNLKSRLVKDSENVDIDKPINFDMVDTIIKKMRVDSLDYLSNSLNF